MGDEGGYPGRQDPDAGQVYLLRFALNSSFQGTDQAEFNMHATSLYSVHHQDFDTTSHQVASVEDEGSRIVSSRRTVFVLADVTLAILEVRLDGVVAPISEVACWSYGLLMRLASRMFD